MINFPHILKQFLTTPQQPASTQIQGQSQQVHPSSRQYTVSQAQPTSSPIELPVLQTVKIELDANLTIEQLNEHLNLKGIINDCMLTSDKNLKRNILVKVFQMNFN